jgi:hypothetical protein
MDQGVLTFFLLDPVVAEVMDRVKDAQTRLEILVKRDARQEQAKEIVVECWQSSFDPWTANPP